MKRGTLNAVGSAIGAWFVVRLEHLGAVTDLMRRTAVAIVRPPFAFGELIRQMEAVGVRSMPIVVLTAIFSSLVMTVQMAVQLKRFGSIDYVGSVVALSLVRELGPVLTALLVGGRVGAGITAELGSMVVTEQVDAIRSMGADPVKKLVVPRVVAAVVMLPLLTTIADVIGVVAAALVSRFEYGISFRYFRSTISQSVRLSDFTGGVIKTLFFGFFLGVIACHEGLATRGGTAGVNYSTTRAVVISSVVTLITDFVLTSILLSMGY